MNKIFGIPALEDNYIWAIHGKNNAHVAIIDPGEAAPVLTYLKDQNLILDAILLTHHHLDHTGGVLALLEKFPNIRVYGSVKDKVPGITEFVHEGESIILENQDLTLKVMEIPGHTHGHIAFYNDEILFCGDTLFSVGCGRIFEGTAKQMYQALAKFKQLPPNTLVYSAHEYTLSNIEFAQTVDSDNEALEMRRQEVTLLREQNQPSLPVVLSQELKTNPFLRCEDEAIHHAVERYWGETWNNPIAIFEHLRKWKDEF